MDFFVHMGCLYLKQHVKLTKLLFLTPLAYLVSGDDRGVRQILSAFCS